MRRALGEHIFPRYIELKRREWDEYRVQVTEWEKEKYLAVAVTVATCIQADESRMMRAAGCAARRAASPVSDGRSRAPWCGARGRSAWVETAGSPTAPLPRACVHRSSVASRPAEPAFGDQRARDLGRASRACRPSPRRDDVGREQDDPTMTIGRLEEAAALAAPRRRTPIPPRMSAIDEESSRASATMKPIPSHVGRRCGTLRPYSPPCESDPLVRRSASAT